MSLSYLHNVDRGCKSVSFDCCSDLLVATRLTHYSPLQRVREVLHLSQARRVRLRGRACSCGAEGEASMGDWLSASRSRPLSLAMLTSAADMRYHQRAATSTSSCLGKGYLVWRKYAKV